MRGVQRGPLAGLAAALGLLAALAATVGLPPSGWVGGVATAVVLTLTLNVGLVHAGAAHLGPADRITLTRATLVCAVAALVVDPRAGAAVTPAVAVLASIALVLDGVDGWVARHTGTTSGLGARFDMEVDAFLILVLSVAASRTWGAWVLLIGAARYALWAAELVVPWLRAAVPFRYWRKVVAAIQGVVLTVAVSEVAPPVLTVAALAVALALLTESFGRDVWWLRTHRSTGCAEPQPVPAAPPANAAERRP
jgi:phosphatidylglycerophosphate synthase